MSPFVHFGDKNESLADLKARFPKFQFHALQQVHGVDVIGPVHGTPKTVLDKADGHWSMEPGNALCIQTADCLPILAHHPKTNALWALHAGWRGVVANIIRAAFSEVKEREQIQVWIGPHISKESFVVQTDIINKFPRDLIVPRIDGSYLVDLTTLALTQLSDLGMQNVSVLPINTFADLNYHSFRREKSSGRQWSFIAL